MDNIGEEYNYYWETNMFLQTEELESWGFDEAFSGYYDSSSPDGGASISAGSGSKNIVSERNRRKKLNDRLFALRAVVPKISKMDKASIIKDAIDYIQELQEEERRINAEILELESRIATNNNVNFSFNDQQIHDSNAVLRSKKKKKTASSTRTQHPGGSYCREHSPIENVELRISYMGEKTMAVTLSCSKRDDTMVRVCEVFESLSLKIITANITAFAGGLSTILLVEMDEEEKDTLKIKIEAAIATLNDPSSPMSI